MPLRTRLRNVLRNILRTLAARTVLCDAEGVVEGGVPQRGAVVVLHAHLAARSVLLVLGHARPGDDAGVPLGVAGPPHLEARAGRGRLCAEGGEGRVREGMRFWEKFEGRRRVASKKM